MCFQQVKEANAEITATEKKIKKLEEEVEKLQDDAREKENELSEAKVLAGVTRAKAAPPLGPGRQIADKSYYLTELRKCVLERGRLLPRF